MNDPSIKTYEFSELSLAPNPRKTLNPDTIIEMGRSILEHGIIQPPVAREREGRPHIYMGQRRYRGLEWAIAEAQRLGLPAKNESSVRVFASRAEELMRVQVILREISDEAMLFEQWVENLQREEVLPQEEAQGFYELSQTHNPATGQNYTAAEIAKAVGRATKKGEPDEKYVLRRMKLRLAPEFFLEAVNRNEVAATTAELLGKIPDAQSREQAAKMILQPEDAEQPLNYALAKSLIREKFMISLTGCGFDLEDEGLVPVELVVGERKAGGACTDCPMRSGNNKEVQAEFAVGRQGAKGGRPGVDPNLCTHPTCFRAKKMAHWQRVRAGALEAGHQVIDGKEAKETFGGYNGGLAYDTKLVDLAKPMGNYETGSYIANPPKWGEVAKHADVPLVYALNPFTSNIHLLAEKAILIEKVKEAAKAAGEKSIFNAPNSNGSSTSLTAGEKRAREEAAMKAKLGVELAYRAATLLREKIAEKGIGLDEACTILEVALERGGADGCYFLRKMLGLKLTKEDKTGGSGRDYAHPVMKHVRETATTLPQLLAWLPLAIVARGLKNSTGPYGGGIKGDEGFMALAKAYSIDVKRIEGEVAEELKQGKKAKATKAPGKKTELKTVTRSKSAARNQASIMAAEKAEQKAPGAELIERECAHCREVVTVKSEAEFDAHVKKCSRRPAKKSKAKDKPKKPSRAERLKARLKTPGTTTKAK